VEGQEATGEFTQVGERYRFKRELPGRAVPTVTVTWISRALLPFVRLGALVSAAWLTSTLLPRRTPEGERAYTPPFVYIRAGVGLIGLLAVAWYVEGVHRSLLWGVDLGLLALVARTLGRDTGGWRSPSRAALLDLWTGRNVRRAGMFALAGIGLLLVPMAWSTLALGALAWRARRLA
jgi:hypothetical protein